MAAPDTRSTDPVDAVLGALGDPTRRAVFEAVAGRGPLTATALAGELPVSRQAVTKHLERLADAALVTADRVGRETRWRATPEPLIAAQRWLDQVGAAWDRRLTALQTRASAAADARDGTSGTDRTRMGG